MKFLLMYLFLLPSILHSQPTGWVWLNPLPQGNQINDLVFCDNSTGYAAASYNTILKTTNGGTNWFNISDGIAKATSSVGFLNAYTGIISGSNYTSPSYSRIIKTTNGGLTWFRVQFDSAKTISNITFQNSNTVFGSYGPELFKSTDAGLSWSLASNLVYTITSVTAVSQDLLCVSVLNYNNYYSQILCSPDGGVSWYDYSTDRYMSVKKVSFADAVTGFAAANSMQYSHILKTTDSGHHWMYTDSVPYRGFESVQFVDQNTGYIFGKNLSYSYITVYRTTNKGTSWNEVMYRENSYYNFARFKSDNSGIISGGTGEMLKTSNGGFNWFSEGIITNKTLDAVQFFNPSTGYITGAGGLFMKTYNGGANWELLRIDSLYEFFKMCFTDPNNGFVYGARYSSPYTYTIMYKTTNAGASWSVDPAGATSLINDIMFINSQTGFFATNSGYVYKTTNAGGNWQSVFYISNRKFFSIRFVNGQTGYLGGSLGAILKSTNGGINWESKYIGTNDNLRSIFFLNENTGYVTGLDPNYSITNVYKTTDGGESWSSTFAGNGNHYSVHFTDIQNGHLCGTGGSYLRTTNGGLNWFRPVTITGYDMNSVFFTDYNTGYITGSSGMILKTTSGGLTGSEITTNGSITISEYSLKQNYPNPFNPETIVRFSLLKSGNVKINVYDIRGCEIKSFNQGYKQAGEYSVIVNLGGYSSGIYFYSLIADEFTETKKMILIK